MNQCQKTSLSMNSLLNASQQTMDTVLELSDRIISIVFI